MLSEKVTKSCRLILAVIDILLAIAVVVCAVCLISSQVAVYRLPKQNMEQQTQEYSAKKIQLESEIQEKQASIAAYTQECQAELDAQEAVLAGYQGDYAAALKEQEAAQQALDDMDTQIETLDNIEQSIADLRKEYGQAVRKLEDQILAGESPYRICYLTFDDGPSYFTPEFLDKLDELDIYATFFTIGVEMDSYNYELRDSYLRREAASGHTIANHTYTHAYYGPVYKSVESFMDAVRQQDELVYNVTGVHTDIVRFPAGSYYCPQRSETIDALHAEGFTFVDWNANAFDAGSNGYTAQYTADSVLIQVHKLPISVVLMHDWVRTTLDSLELFVPQLKEENYIFLPLFPESSMMETAKE